MTRGYDFQDGVSLMDPEGQRPGISFLRAPEPKTAKNRCHLDDRPAADIEDADQRDEVIRAKVSDLVAVGATVTRKAIWERHVEGVVMVDREGNEFCVA